MLQMKYSSSTAFHLLCYFSVLTVTLSTFTQDYLPKAIQKHTYTCILLWFSTLITAPSYMMQLLNLEMERFESSSCVLSLCHKGGAAP